jgi:hypothetical protein
MFFEAIDPEGGLTVTVSLFHDIPSWSDVPGGAR